MVVPTTALKQYHWSKWRGKFYHSSPCFTALIFSFWFWAALENKQLFRNHLYQHLKKTHWFIGFNTWVDSQVLETFRSIQDLKGYFSGFHLSNLRILNVGSFSPYSSFSFTKWFSSELYHYFKMPTYHIFHFLAQLKYKKYKEEIWMVLSIA